MCFSSSTTRIFGLIVPPIASLDHRGVKAMFYRCERTVRRLLLRGSCTRPAALFGAQHELDRVAHQTEPVANLLLEVAAVAEMQEVGVVHEQNHRGRLVLGSRALRSPGGLCRVGQPQAPALVARRRVLLERLA